MILDLANPTRFTRFSGRVLPWLSGLGAALLAVGLYLAFFVAPADYQQGETVRIMYVHVPSAWLGMAGWGGIAAASYAPNITGTFRAVRRRRGGQSRPRVTLPFTDSSATYPR